MTATPQPLGTLAIPEAEHRVPPTSPEHLDAAIATLGAASKTWAETLLEDRIALLDELVETTVAAAGAWGVAGTDHKRIPADSPLVGEEHLNGPLIVVRHLAYLRRTLADVRDHGRPRPNAIAARSDGRVVVDVFPVTLSDRIIFAGFHGEVRMQPGVSVADVEEGMARCHRGDGRDPGVALVLGAGNVSSIGPMDALAQLFGRLRTVVLKLNPINEHLGPHIAEAFAPLVRRDLLRVVYGGAAEGAYLTDHPDIDHIHITGSNQTFDSIVFGSGEEGARRKQAGEQRIDTPISSELGNVTPVIVVPGPWSDRDLRFQGANLASMLTQNAGFNCVASRMIIQHGAWARRRRLLDEVRRTLAQAEERYPYYPGAVDRWRSFTAAHGDAECYGLVGDDRVPFTLLPELDEGDRSEIAFTTEAFAAVMGTVSLEAPRSLPEYLHRAVEFCNDRLWGNLAATIVVHPRSLADPAASAAVERAIDDLRYGTVMVNHFPGAGYGFVSTPWGAYPGNPIDDIQSGQGWVHNSFLLDEQHIEKAVIRGPFRVPAKPPWFVGHRTLPDLAPALTAVEGGDLRALPKVMWHLLRG